MNDPKGLSNSIESRVVRGTQALLDARRKQFAADEPHIGWKMGYGAPSARARLGIKVPLAGYLTGATQVAAGATVSIADWSKPCVEPEIAIYLGRDLQGPAGNAEVRAVVSAVGVAFELVDLGNPSTDVEVVLSRNIAHKKFVLGPRDAARGGGLLKGLSARVLRNGVEVASSNDPQNANGDLIENVREMTEVLAACGEHFRAGDAIITGSIVAPLPVEVGQEITFHLDPIGSLVVRF